MGEELMRPLFVLAAMLVWTVAAVVIAWAARKGMGEGAVEFFIGGRRLRGFVSGMTYAATTYSAFMLVGLVGLTYRSGVGALGFEMTYLIFTILFLIVFGPRFWLVGNRYQHVTPPELLAERYRSRAVAVTSAVISFFMLIPYSSVQLMGAGFLVSGLTGGRIPYMAGVLFMAGLSGFAAWWAGMRSVAWTDAFQALTMIVTAIIALLFITFAFFGSPAGFVDTITTEHPDLLSFTWDPKLFIGLALPWAFFALTNPQVAQRMYVPDRMVSLKRMVIYFSIFGFLYTIISTLYGMQAAHLVPGLENPDQAMPSLLTRVPAILGLIIFIGIFAAATSTLGSIILTLGSMFARDVVRNLAAGTGSTSRGSSGRPAELSSRTETWVGRVSMLALLAFCIVFAWFRPGLISVLSSMASGGLLVMAPTLIAAFFWKRATAWGAVVSMVAGGVLTAALYLFHIYPFGWWPPVWGLGLTSLLFVLVSLLTPAPDGAKEFIDTVERELEEQGFRLRRGS
jgi:SSS family solute:Na+ symporter